MKFKGVVYDLDGVLLDTEYYQYMGWVEPLKEFNVELPEEEYIRHYAGKSGPLIEKELIKQHNLPIENGQLLNKKEKLLIDWFSTKDLMVMPYVREAITYFKGLGLKNAVCSGGPMDEILIKLKRSALLNYFEWSPIVSRDDVKHGKPHPDMYLEAVGRFGLQPEECVAFEDTQYGAQSAKDAGLYCVAMPTRWSAYQDFSRADMLVKGGFEEAIKRLSLK